MMEEKIRVVKIVCINGACQHIWFTDVIQYSHIKNKCVKCGTEWSQRNNQSSQELSYMTKKEN